MESEHRSGGREGERRKRKNGKREKKGEEEIETHRQVRIHRYDINLIGHLYVIHVR